MGQYKFYISFRWQIGILFTYLPGLFLEFQLPFCTLAIGLQKRAKGFCWESQFRKVPDIYYVSTESTRIPHAITKEDFDRWIKEFMEQHENRQRRSWTNEPPYFEK